MSEDKAMIARDLPDETDVLASVDSVHARLEHTAAARRRRRRMTWLFSVIGGGALFAAGVAVGGSTVAFTSTPQSIACYGAASDTQAYVRIELTPAQGIPANPASNCFGQERSTNEIRAVGMLAQSLAATGQKCGVIRVPEGSTWYWENNIGGAVGLGLTTGTPFDGMPADCPVAVKHIAVIPVENFAVCRVDKSTIGVFVRKSESPSQTCARLGYPEFSAEG
jgi:hypothetical protein